MVNGTALLTGSTTLESHGDGEAMSLGPRLDVFWSQCLHNNKGPFLFALVIGVGCALVTLALALKAKKRLLEGPVCLLRSYYTNMLIFPSAWALSALVTILCPRSSLLAEMMRGLTEAYALFMFLCVMWSVLSIEAMNHLQKQSEHTPINRDTVNCAHAIINLINEGGPKKHFAVPPYGCFFVKCCPELKMTAKSLLRATFFAKQYVWMQLVLSIFSMWAEMTMPAEMGEKVAKYSAIILKISALTAIYGLFIVYKATHEALHEWRTTAKFISIKFVIILSMLLQFVVSHLIKKFRKPDHTCLMDPYDPTSLEFVIAHYNAVCISIASVLMIHLVSKAFPKEELKDTFVRHIDLMDMELQQLGDYGDSDEGSSSE